MIQRGLSDADTLGNYLPIFQKKLKNPQGAAANQFKKTEGFDYSKKSEAHKSRAGKL